MKKVLALFITLSALSAFASQGQKDSPALPLPQALQMLQLSLSPGMVGDLDLKLAVDVTTKPAAVKAQFRRFNEEGKVLESCQFSKALSASEVQKFKEALAQVRYCNHSTEDEMVVDPEYVEALLVYSQKPTRGQVGRGAQINKYFLTGWSPQKYLCQGGANLYNVMKSFASQRAPKSCPKTYSKLFAYHPEQY